MFRTLKFPNEICSSKNKIVAFPVIRIEQKEFLKVVLMLFESKAVVRIPNSGYERKTKILKSRDFAGAVKEFLDFKEQVLNTILFQEADKKSQSPFLQDTIAKYIDYMNDVVVPFHLQKNISPTLCNASTTGQHRSIISTEKK